MRNDLYNQRNEKIELKTKGKHYYRITWSNPVNLSTKGGTNDSLYMRYYISALAGSELINDNSQLTEAGFKALSILKNYQFSVIDSFNVTDSVKIDTAVCGQDCNFDLTGISLTPAANHISRNDIAKVGKFDMTVTEISFSGNRATGKGLIFNRLVGKKVKVIFTNVQFNADKRLVDGNVTGEISSGDAFEEAFGALPAGIPLADLAKDKLKDPVQSSKIYRYINSPFVLGSDIFSDDPITLPIGISKEVDNFPATIAFTDMIFTPTRATVNAAAVIYWVYEEQQQFLGFTGNGFCMNEQGLANITNGASLELVGDIPMQINDSLLIKIIGKQDINPNLHSTRIEWDCKGLKDIALVVSATLPRSIFVPEENNKRSAFGRVTGIAEVHISSIQNFMVAFAIDKPFQFAPLPEFTFKVNTVSLDMSDHVNPAGITFPTGYNGQTGNAWRGLYIGDAEVKLPLAFESKNSPGTRLALNTHNLLIDPSGFTANIGVNNILAIQDGELASWKFSIDRLAISIINNTLSNCALTGSFGVPLFTGNIGYELAISPNLKKDSTTLNFTLAPKDTLTMAAWFAQVTILQTSTIKLNGAISDINSWKLSSNLNGDIGFGADNMAGIKNVRLGKLPFEGLKLATYITNLDSFEFNLEKLGGIDMNRVIQANSAPTTNTPAVTPPAPTTPSGTPEKQEMAGFPIGIGDFSLDIIRKKPCMFELPGVPADAIRIGIKFKINLNLSEGEGDKKNGLSGSCGLGLYAYMQKSGDFLSFTPAGLNVDTIKIDLEVGGVATVRGAILFMANDPVFGNGFQGMAEAYFAPAFNGSVSAIFGEKDGERYFMFDAQIGFDPGIPIDFTVGAIFANSFGGGIWYKMKMTPPANAAEAGAKLTLGKSASGNSFVPDKTKSLGFEARLGLTGPPGTPVFGEVTLAAEFSDQWSLDKLSFGGNLWFTQRIKSQAEVFIAGRVTIDLKEQRLLGSLGALVNVASGTVRGRTEQVISGTTYYLAGNVDMLVDFAKKTWHIKMGDPYTNNRMGFGFYAGKTQLFEAGGYFMMGNKMPKNLPPVKPELATNLSLVGLSVPTGRKVPASDSAFAILAGIDAGIPEKRIELGMFYAGISFGFAVDGILENKTQNCPRDGFKGWYVTGKAYAALNGALGLKVSTPFFTGDVIAGEINAGAILDAGFANPYYIMGQFAAGYSVFGGLFEGTQTFNFEYLEDPQCRPVLKSTLVYGGIVSDRTPAPASPGAIPSEISVGVEPVISLTYKLDAATKFEFPATVLVRGVQVDTILTKFIRTKMASCSLIEVNGAKRTPVNINTIVSDDDMDVRIKPQSYLKDQQTRYEVMAKFFIEERMNGTNTWTKVKRTIANKQVDWDTVLTYQFKTEQEATFQDSFITFSNPKKGERFYKKFPSRTGKIVTKQDGVQATFFKNSTPSQFRPFYEYYMECSPAGDMNDTFRRSLSFSNNEIYFELPNSKIQKEGHYQIRIIRLYRSNQVLNANSRFENLDISTSNNSGPSIRFDGSPNNLGNQKIINDAKIQMQQRKAGNAIEPRAIMHTINFGVSKHSNMSDKLEQLQLPSDRNKVPFSGDVAVLSLETDEPFEVYEVKADTIELPNGRSSIIPPSIILKNYRDENLVNNWYKDYYRPKILYAFDTISRKFASLAYLQTMNQFRALADISTKVDGMNVVFDRHIVKPFSYNSMMFDYRVAQISYSSLQNQLRNVEFLSTYDVNLSSTTVNRVFDPLTGTYKNGPPINTNNPPPAPPQPASGSRLTLEFTNYNLARNQQAQLISLGQLIFNACGPPQALNNVYTYTYIRGLTLTRFTLTAKEQNLFYKIRQPSLFPFQGSTDLDLYNLDFHISNNSTVRNSLSFSNSEIFGLRQAIIAVYTTNGN